MGRLMAATASFSVRTPKTTMATAPVTQMTQVSMPSWGWNSRARVVRMKMMYPARSLKGERASRSSARACRALLLTGGSAGENLVEKKTQ